MHLVSLSRQDVTVAGRTFPLPNRLRPSTPRTPTNTVGEFQDLAREAGWQPEEVWTDKDLLFSVHELAESDADLSFRSRPSY